MVYSVSKDDHFKKGFAAAVYHSIVSKAIREVRAEFSGSFLVVVVCAGCHAKEQRIAAPLHTIHVHSVSDSTYLLCNLVFLASQCNSQRHAFELLCERSALVSIRRMKPCCTANPGFVAYFKYWQGLFSHRDGETSGLFAVKIYNDLHV